MWFSEIWEHMLRNREKGKIVENAKLHLGTFTKSKREKCIPIFSLFWEHMLRKLEKMMM